MKRATGSNISFTTNNNLLELHLKIYFISTLNLLEMERKLYKNEIKIISQQSIVDGDDKRHQRQK
jgi:hypothetical protein